ncbi:MAG: hypothetical protein ACFB9M_14905 [Myxococcota bacterium]
MGALPAEVSGVIKRLVRDGAGPTLSIDLQVEVGLIRGRTVVVTATGDGALRAARLGALLDLLSPARVITVGLAGGLDPELPPGSMVAVQRVLRSNGQLGFDLEVDMAPPGLVAALQGKVPRSRRGCLYSADTIVETAEAKATLWEQLGQPAGAVVDLETETYVGACRGRGFPVTVYKVVSDAAHESLPDVISASVDERGSVRPARVALAAAFRPRTWETLLRLGRRLHRASEVLGQVVERHLSSLN